MATHFRIGTSRHPDPEQAFKEAALMVKEQLNVPSIDIALALFTAEYAQPGAQEPALRLLQPRRMIGSSTSALIDRDRIIERGVLIIGITSDELTFGTRMSENIGLDHLHGKGLKFARMIESDSGSAQRQALLFFIDGLQKNLSPFCQGLQETLGRVFPLIGLVGADKDRAHTYQSFEEKIVTDSVTGLLIGGSLSIAMSSRHGWHPLGKPRIITQAEGNVIKLIDSKPAISIYQDYFQEEMARKETLDLKSIGVLYPLGINTNVPKEYILRHPIEALPDGSITFQANVPPGARVHLMIGDKDACRQATRDVAIELKEQLFGRPPQLILVFASQARKKLFGKKSSQELDIIKEILGLTAPMVGMYTYGEIAPRGNIQDNRTSEPQSATMTIMAIG